MDQTRTADRPRRRRHLRFTLRRALLLIGLIACSLGAYRYYDRHIRKRTTSYQVADLIPGRLAGRRSRSMDDFAPLIAAIRSKVAPRSWQGQGGSGTMVEFFLNDSLIVTSTEVHHEELAAFLRQKRAAR
jgi:hypothetical protein